MTKHTHSPWLSDGSTDNGDFVIFNENCNHNVIEIRYGSINPDDFNLILVAPEMYEMLSEIANELGVFSGICDNPLTDDGREKIEALLAKARGEI